MKLAKLEIGKLTIKKLKTHLIKLLNLNSLFKSLTKDIQIKVLEGEAWKIGTTHS